MLHVIRDTTDPLIKLIADDPVRPHIPSQWRVEQGKEILVTLDGERPTAVVCVSYQDHVPEDESELDSAAAPTVAVFYTIWSYVPGAGRKMIFKARDHIRTNWPTVSRFVTLSPQTDMARRFHLHNGAIVARENPTSVNYEYI